ncbi:hypothetical protein [Actinoplanes sp. URMC 104]|uniref:hypothetical protein n=1 Tax=Actinoplanes sp. URMC 104 TaxID=3423409 RepID=UPI003F1ACC8C
MKSRLSRPLLAAVISGAFLAGGGAFAGPAFADPVPPGAPGSPEPTSAPTSTTPSPTLPTEPPATTSPTDTPPTTPTKPPASSPTSSPTSSGPTTTTSPVPPTTPPVTTPPPAADKTAPTGNFTLNRWSIWTGQTVTVSLGTINDNVSGPAEIKRVLTWGDGTSQTLHHTAKNITHTYKSSGKKPITLTLTDAAGNKRVVKSVGPKVSVPALKYKLNKSSVWHGEKFVWEITQVPAGAKKITVNWGDGRSSVLPIKKQKVTRYYFTTPTKEFVTPGAKTLRAVVYNKYGAAATLTVGKVTLKKDSWRPVLKLTKPSKPGKASSWKAIKGTASDKGAGIKQMWAAAIVVKSNNSIVCYNGKKWVSIDAANAVACDRPVKVSKGKFSFSVPLKSTPKGYLVIGLAAGDWAGNPDNFVPYEQRIS